MSKKFFVAAGEVSGDRLGAELMQALGRLYPDDAIHWSGMGGPLMQANGLASDEDISQLSIMGISGAIGGYGRLQGLANRLVAQVIEVKPDVIFTIDSKAFSVRFAKKLRREMRKINWSAPIIHFVAPTIWAWGKWRRHAFETQFDGMLCLFPFEPDLFDKQKLNARFVGHPMGFAERPTIDRRDPNIVGLLPGSRASEIHYILPDMLASAGKILAARSNTRFLLPAPPHLVDKIQNQVAKAQLPVEILTNQDSMTELLSRASVCMAASGTVTLELALSAMPTIACYKVSWLNYLFMKGLFRLRDPILPHILLQQKIFPYFEQTQQTSHNLAKATLATLDDLDAQQQKLDDAAARLSKLLTGGQTSFQTQLQSALQSILQSNEL